jgi:Arc/MetJ family transcription regulator
MSRTTINLDASVLQQLKRRQRREQKPMSELVNQLLARALAEAEAETDEQARRPLRWTIRPMEARVDLEDKETLQRALDQS